MSRERRASSPAAGGATSLLTVVAAGALLVLTTWAAAIGPQPVLRSPGEPRSQSAETTRPQPESGLSRLQRFQRQHPPSPGPAPAWARLLVVGLEALIVGLVGFGLWRAARHLFRRWRDRERPPPREPDPDDLGVLDAGARLAEVIEADAEAQADALGDGEPRNAIVACWHRFETAAGRVGVRRRPWQTPSEFVLEVLDAAGADPGPVTRLAELYREARFSDHPLTEAHRQAAMQALRATHGSLRRSVDVGGPV